MDRISPLPDQILIHILSFLPMKQVIGTASLSKRWRFLWFSASSLLFHFNGSNHEACYFIDFMATTMMFHNAPKIKKFSVTFNAEWTCRSNRVTTVNTWIRFATLKFVEELHIHLSGTIYSLPQQLYKNDHIRIMSFKGCSLAYLPTSVSWGSLESLSIAGCDNITKQMIWKILDGSPKIVCLDVIDSYDPDRKREVNHHYEYFRGKYR